MSQVHEQTEFSKLVDKLILRDGEDYAFMKKIQELDLESRERNIPIHDVIYEIIMKSDLKKKWSHR